MLSCCRSYRPFPTFLGSIFVRMRPFDLVWIATGSTAARLRKYVPFIPNSTTSYGNRPHRNHIGRDHHRSLHHCSRWSEMSGFVFADKRNPLLFAGSCRRVYMSHSIRCRTVLQKRTTNCIPSHWFQGGQTSDRPLYSTGNDLDVSSVQSVQSVQSVRSVRSVQSVQSVQSVHSVHSVQVQVSRDGQRRSKGA